MHAPLVPAADRTRPLPTTPTARQDAAGAALRALRDEQERLVRLGLETPLARCQAELRYWSFLAALHALPAGRGGAGKRGEDSWPGARVP